MSPDSPLPPQYDPTGLERELYGLDEAFITSTTQGVMPVTWVDGRVVGNGRRGEITLRLQQQFDQIEASVP